MEISETQFEHIAHCLPVQRGTVRLSNLQVLNAILYVAEQGCTWRDHPEHFGPWHTIYTRMMRWDKSGVLNQVFEALQARQMIQIKIEAVSLDSDHQGAPRWYRRSKNRSPSHRQIPGWLDHQNSSGCRE